MGRPEQLRHGASSFGRVIAWRPPERLTILGRNRVRRATGLNWATRVILGLMHMGYRETCELSYALGPMREADILCLEPFVKLLDSSEDPLIARCIREGLPVQAVAELPFPNTVRCPGCGSLVNVVPCVSCINEKCREDAQERDDFDDWRPRPASIPTEARPGTMEKIEVMRRRIEQGEAPFHPEDAIRVNYDKLSGITIKAHAA